MRASYRNNIELSALFSVSKDVQNIIRSRKMRSNCSHAISCIKTPQNIFKCCQLSLQLGRIKFRRIDFHMCSRFMPSHRNRNRIKFPTKLNRFRAIVNSLVCLLRRGSSCAPNQMNLIAMVIVINVIANGSHPAKAKRLTGLLADCNTINKFCLTVAGGKLIGISVCLDSSFVVFNTTHGKVLNIVGINIGVKRNRPSNIYMILAATAIVGSSQKIRAKKHVTIQRKNRENNVMKYRLLQRSSAGIKAENAIPNAIITNSAADIEKPAIYVCREA